VNEREKTSYGGEKLNAINVGCWREKRRRELLEQLKESIRVEKS